MCKLEIKQLAILIFIIFFSLVNIKIVVYLKAQLR